SVVVEAEQGIDYVIRHLIQTHGRRSFALITGPENHPESRLRCQKFYETLNEEAIPASSVARYQGDFRPESGKLGVASLLKSGVTFDALFCLNDNMAMGAMEELESQGYQIPEDISLVGFDGIEESQFFNPRLTTIRQPIHELGEASVELIFSQLAGVQSEQRVLQCKPLIGESCGCKALKESVQNPDVELFTRAYTYAPSDIDQITQLIQAQREPDLLEKIIEILGNSIHSPSALQSLLTILYSIQDRIVHEPSEASRHDIEGVLSVIAKAVTFLNKQLIFSLFARRLRDYEQSLHARSFGANISEAFDKESILETMREGLHVLGFAEGYFGFLTYWKDVNANDSEPWELYHISDQVRYVDKFSGGFLELPDIMKDAWSGSRWVIKPLVWETEIFGVLILPVKVHDPGFYDIISKQIASTLKGYHLMEQVKRHEQSLEATVRRRTLDLIRLNAKLQTEVELRTRLEQEVVEISNHTMNRIGQDLHDDLCQHLAGIAMMTKVLGNSMPPGSHEARTVEHINGMLGNSIERARNIARGLVTVGNSKHDFVATVESLVESLEKISGIPITLHVDRQFAMRSSEQRSQMYRIIQEALNNAIRHSECNTITVTLGTALQGTEPGFVIRIEDDGKGLTARESSTGMGLQIMEYRAEKAGVSLELTRSDKGGTAVVCVSKTPHRTR
ncbi:MAG: substrate-binding domain-containing protein, partial [Spirochaetota bacterium]